MSSLSQAPRRVEPILAGVEDEDVVSVGVEQDRLAPQVRLIEGIANELKSHLPQLLNGLVNILDLEVDARASLDRAGDLGVVGR